MKTRRHLVPALALAVSVLVAAPATAQAPPATRGRVDVSKLGPQVGERVPDFTLADQTGQRRTLQSLMGPRGAMIVFYRSADWCPFCRTQLVELQSQVEDLRKNGLSVVGISYDPVPVLADFANRHQITYPLLSDSGSATIKRYGILNTVVEEALGPNGNDPAVLKDLQIYATVGAASERLRGIPFTGTFIVDRQGRVTSRFFEDYYWERNTTSSLLLRLGAARTPVQGMQASTQHLTVTTYPSDATVALGNRFSLAFEITPKPGIHVYAPGASSYRVITVNVAPQPHVRTFPLRYPASEVYHFVPLNERVPTYQKPFLLTMDVVPEATAEARKALAGASEIVINGTLDYQACDDRICYNPVSLPLTWKVGLRGNVPAAPAPATAQR